jgi:hypothetical protein
MVCKEIDDQLHAESSNIAFIANISNWIFGVFWKHVHRWLWYKQGLHTEIVDCLIKKWLKSGLVLREKTLEKDYK